MIIGWEGGAYFCSMAPFYVFPCGHSFHANCLIAHVMRCTNEAQAEYILDLQKQLALLGNELRPEMNESLTEEEPLTSMSPGDKIRSQSDDAIASECPFCGDLMIREISLPFILPDEMGEMESWEIKLHKVASQMGVPNEWVTQNIKHTFFSYTNISSCHLGTVYYRV